MTPGIIGIDHVQIAVPKAREAEALRFYREILALPEIAKPEDLRRGDQLTVQLDENGICENVDAKFMQFDNEHDKYKP